MVQSVVSEMTDAQRKQREAGDKTVWQQVSGHWIQIRTYTGFYANQVAAAESAADTRNWIKYASLPVGDRPVCDDSCTCKGMQATFT